MRTQSTFKVDDAEKLKAIADESIDLAICIGALEHMLDKRAVLASTYRVLKFGGRFICLTLPADYVWYQAIVPLLGFQRPNADSRRIRLAASSDRISGHSICSLGLHSQGRRARGRCIAADHA